MVNKIKKLRKVTKELALLLKDLTQLGLELATLVAILKMVIETLFSIFE